MPDIEQELFEFLDRPASIIDYLDSLSFDELVEVDLFNNRIRNLFHVEGKYHVPVFDGEHKDLYRYAVVNMIHPSDTAIHEAFMNHDSLLEPFPLHLCGLRGRCPLEGLAEWEACHAHLLH